MKFKYILLLIPLAGAMIAPMYIKGPNGKPLMTWDDWIPKDAKTLVKSAADMAKSSSASSDSGNQIYYKWKDTSGVWQMTEFRPSHLPESEIEVRTVSGNSNIIQSLDADTISATLNRGSETVKKPKFTYNPKTPVDLLKDDKDDSGFSLTTIPMEKIPKLFEQVKGYEGELQKRKAAMDQETRK